MQPGRKERTALMADGSGYKRCGVVFAFLLAALLLLLLVNIASGSVSIAPGEIFRILFRREGDPTNCNIVWQIRFPRALAAVHLGGGLSVSGFALQTFFHNPIAGPFVLGISSGAKLAVALVMILLLNQGRPVSSFEMVLAAFGGAMLSMCFVLAVSVRTDRMSVLIVAGVMIGYICSAVTDFVVTFADDSNIVNLHGWSLGSFSGMTWENVSSMSLIILPAFLLVFFLSKPIGAYLLGENYARSLGVNVRLLQTALVLLSSVLSAAVTAFAGPVSFVGIAVPHLTRNLLRTSRPVLVIPASFLGGSVFCLLCDLIARTVFAPTELSISSVTAIFGAPVVIWMMLRKKREG